MRNWHALIINLNSAISVIENMDISSNPTLFLGIVEGYLEYEFDAALTFPIDKSNYKAKSLSLDINYASKKSIIRAPNVDNTFFTDKLYQDYPSVKQPSGIGFLLNSYDPSEHAVAGAGTMAGYNLGTIMQIKGICQNAKILNSHSTHEIVLQGLVQKYFANNLNSEFVKNVVLTAIDISYLKRICIPQQSLSGT